MLYEVTTNIVATKNKSAVNTILKDFFNESYLVRGKIKIDKIKYVANLFPTII
jgi:hypothetical protein